MGNKKRKAIVCLASWIFQKDLLEDQADFGSLIEYRFRRREPSIWTRRSSMTSTIEGHEQVPCKQIEIEVLRHDPGVTIEAFSHVRGLGIDANSILWAE